MVAPEPARSFIVSEPPVWLDKSTCRVRTHARGLDDIHVESSVRWTTDVTMYSGSMSFKINPPGCYSAVLTKVILSELFHNTYMTTFMGYPFNEQGQMSQENIEGASLDYQGSILLGFP